MSDDTAELDEYAADLYAEFKDSTEVEDKAEQRRVKARDQLKAWLSVRDAKVGTVNGEPVVQLIESTSMRVDSARLKTEEPFLFQRYSKAVRSVTLRLKSAR